MPKEVNFFYKTHIEFILLQLEKKVDALLVFVKKPCKISLKNREALKKACIKDLKNVLCKIREYLLEEECYELVLGEVEESTANTQENVSLFYIAYGEKGSLIWSIIDSEKEKIQKNQQIDAEVLKMELGSQYGEFNNALIGKDLNKVRVFFSEILKITLKRKWNYEDKNTKEWLEEISIKKKSILSKLCEELDFSYEIQGEKDLNLISDKMLLEGLEKLEYFDKKELKKYIEAKKKFKAVKENQGTKLNDVEHDFLILDLILDMAAFSITAEQYRDSLIELKKNLFDNILPSTFSYILDNPSKNKALESNLCQKIENLKSRHEFFIHELNEKVGFFGSSPYSLEYKIQNDIANKIDINQIKNRIISFFKINSKIQTLRNTFEGKNLLQELILIFSSIDEIPFDGENKCEINYNIFFLVLIGVTKKYIRYINSKIRSGHDLEIPSLEDSIKFTVELLKKLDFKKAQFLDKCILVICSLYYVVMYQKKCQNPNYLYSYSEGYIDYFHNILQNLHFYNTNPEEAIFLKNQINYWLERFPSYWRSFLKKIPTDEMILKTDFSGFIDRMKFLFNQFFIDPNDKLKVNAFLNNVEIYTNQRKQDALLAVKNMFDGKSDLHKTLPKMSEIEENRECSYIAFGIDRGDAYTLLKDNLNEIKNLLIPAIKEELLKEKFIIYLVKHELVEFQLLKLFRNHEEQVERCLNAHENQNKIFSYVNNSNVVAGYLNYDLRNRQIDDGWSHPCILQALAQIRKIRLYLWVKNNDQRFPHPKYHEYIPEEAIETKHIVFVNGNHFECLLSEDFPESENNNIRDLTSNNPVILENMLCKFEVVLPSSPQIISTSSSSSTKTNILEYSIEGELETLKMRSKEVEGLIIQHLSVGDKAGSLKVFDENVKYFTEEYKRLAILCHPDKVSEERRAWAKKVFIDLSDIVQNSKEVWRLALAGIGGCNSLEREELLNRMNQSLEEIEKMLQENRVMLNSLKEVVDGMIEGSNKLISDVDNLTADVNSLRHSSNQFEKILGNLESRVEDLNIHYTIPGKSTFSL